MVIQRPHILKFNLTAEEPYRDSKGDWVVVDGTGTEVQLSCRAEPNSTGSLIQSQDGKSIVYSWIIYLAKDAPKIPYGTLVKVYKESDLITSGKVNMFSNGQLNTRIWL